MTKKILGDQITDYTLSAQSLSNTITSEWASRIAVPKILYANVTSNTYTILDFPVVTNPNDGFIKITGSGFVSGASVLIDTVPASNVTFVNSTTLHVQVPARPDGSYPLYVVNPDGGTSIRINGITYTEHLINYLVVAGGGGAGGTNKPPGPGSGFAGGTGGAGGFRTGTIFGPKPGTYVITVGAGGSDSGPVSIGQNGANSVFSITASSNNIVSVGGGGGGAGRSTSPPAPGTAGSPGGSGGGGGGPNRPGGAGIPGQGFPGGPGSGPSGPGNQSGTGGGAGGPGNEGNTPTLSVLAGPGAPSTITGSPVTYAIGGSSSSGAGAPNTGNGGGTNQPGGSGIVILSVPTPLYPGTAPPNAIVTTPPATPGRTILTYNSSGTYNA
jgi:hypothetical protein